MGGVGTDQLGVGERRPLDAVLGLGETLAESARRRTAVGAVNVDVVASAVVGVVFPAEGGFSEGCFVLGHLEGFIGDLWPAHDLVLLEFFSELAVEVFHVLLDELQLLFEQSVFVLEPLEFAKRKHLEFCDHLLADLSLVVQQVEVAFWGRCL